MKLSHTKMTLNAGKNCYFGQTGQQRWKISFDSMAFSFIVNTQRTNNNKREVKNVKLNNTFLCSNTQVWKRKDKLYETTGWIYKMFKHESYS